MSSTRQYRLGTPTGLARWWQLAAVALVAVGLGAFASSALAAKVNIVRKSGPPAGKIPKDTAYFPTIQAAVNDATKGDWVLIEPGVYDEEVKVEPEHGGIWIRGMNRNTVVLDGNHEACKHSPCPEGSNGIEINKASNVYVENLTVANFDRAEVNASGGNEIWWNGGAESKKIGASGWYGSYLTAYDTGFDGGYGIFTNNETKGEWKKIYASGFNDSGMYLGACQECKARITEAVMENNALGYSGSNSGGRLVIENSTFRHNTDGIAPNSENPGDGPPPQDGECGRPNVENPEPTPHIGSTKVKRCTIFRGNLITENDNLSVPANNSAAAAPWGAGVEYPGSYADLLEGNTITGNPTDGVLAFEYPNPFPPTTKEEEEEKGYGTIYFQLSGNKIAGNVFASNGFAGGTYAGDVMMEGGLFGSQESINNCFSGNTFGDATYPAKIEETWGCQNKHTPNADIGYPPEEPLKPIEYLLELQYVSEHRSEFATVEGQPAPGEQETMPNACEGVPKNPLCP
jgi:hypothetical protein